MTKEWIRIRFLVDTMVLIENSKMPLTQSDMLAAAANAGTAVRTTAYEGIKNVEVSFLDEHKLSTAHVHNAAYERCKFCYSYAHDDRGPDTTE